MPPASNSREELYDEARSEDTRMPEPVKGVATKIGLARLFAETGSFEDVASWRQILRYGGLDLCQRLPLVRRGSLFGEYYQRKTRVEKMPGIKR